ncbi:hypothetical protein CYMTET_34046 [Cymbomonas tetramitiformis]|uniref:Uncharacterized protein n=1 Tax=Cymbomonas tetramitiformis TaxID=36881 RepID=A0AAE0KQ99_9CHLO|nr:hypothetical protein CYMTET_34046 [Cymbomonas tetramitiformis]
MEVVDARVVWETMANLMDAGVLVTVQSEEIFANNRFEPSVSATTYAGALHVHNPTSFAHPWSRSHRSNSRSDDGPGLEPSAIEYSHVPLSECAVLAEAYGGAGPVVAVMEAARRGAPVGAVCKRFFCVGAPEAATELLHVMVCDAKWEPDNVVVYMLIEVSPNQAKGEEVTSLETLDILRRKPTDKPAFADPPVRPVRDRRASAIL